jgi:hypothetical protein
MDLRQTANPMRIVAQRRAQLRVGSKTMVPTSWRVAQVHAASLASDT